MNMSNLCTAPTNLWRSANLDLLQIFSFKKKIKKASSHIRANRSRSRAGCLNHLRGLAGISVGCGRRSGPVAVRSVLGDSLGGSGLPLAARWYVGTVWLLWDGHWD